MYLHIPSLNILHVVATKDYLPVDSFRFIGAGGLTYTGVISKRDNVKLTALKSVPPHLLSTESVLTTQFNLYPNPATTVVNINSAENMPVNKVTVYDVVGKLLSTQNFNNQTNIQLNTENLASGTYLLHIETAEGTAVKKLVKK